MEIHALKSYLPERASKDYNDVLALITVGSINIESIRPICLKYASEDLYNRIVEDMQK